MPTPLPARSPGWVVSVLASQMLSLNSKGVSHMALVITELAGDIAAAKEANEKTWQQLHGLRDIMAIHLWPRQNRFSAR